MERLWPILVAALTGFLSGFLLSIPVGPVNLTILNEGARRGFRWAALISLGATTMEVAYCFIAFTGFASFFQAHYIKEGMELFTFVFLLYLGIKFLTTRSVETPVQLAAATHRIEERLEQRLHPQSAFMIGLVRVMGNFGVLVVWIFLAANFIAHGWVPPDWPGKLACVAGVALGAASFYLGLSFGASRGHGKLSEGTLLRMEHVSGIGLLLLALIYGFQIILQMARHRI
jgi:threonine/homoserine/homoserine lactone efflux protein